VSLPIRAKPFNVSASSKVAIIFFCWQKKMGVLSTANVLRCILRLRCLLPLHFVSHHAVHPKQNMICHLATCQNRRCGRCVTSHRGGGRSVGRYKVSQAYVLGCRPSKIIAREVVIGCKAGSKALPENYNDIDLVHTTVRNIM
jgi:hypothetical protein